MVGAPAKEKMMNGVAEIALMTEKLHSRGTEPEWKEARFTPLVERARGGDVAAFEEIMLLTERRVVAIAWRMLGEREDARDAAQEVFLRAYKYLRTFKEDQNFTGWLYRITVNVCHDMARRKSVRPEGHATHAVYDTEPDALELEMIPSSDDTELLAIRAQQRAIVGRALGMLSEKERRAIVLRDMEGFSTEEVAHMLGTQPATVRSQISSARVKLKRYCDRFLGARAKG